MKRLPLLLAALLATIPAFARADTAGGGGELANIKVVTDANPDYSDMESMIHSITSNWSTDEDKMYALFYWDHLARRQTHPMWLHGYEVTDPIRQYNDYGYTMCSTISGIKCSEWNYMGYPCRFWEIGLHTVPDVWYDGKFHHYDNSLSAMYTLPDGKTIAAVPDIGATLPGPDGQPVKGLIGYQYCLDATSPYGYLEGADTERPLKHMAVECFAPNHLHYQFQYYGQDRGHRYILNLRDGEVYTRYYSRLDLNTPAGEVADVKGMGKNYVYKHEAGYYIPNVGNKGETPGFDPEVPAARYHIRGTGDRTWTPQLLDPTAFYSRDNLLVLESQNGTSATGISIGAQDQSKLATAIFKVEGANVITALKIHALATLATADDSASIAISTTNGLQWKEVWKSSKAGENPIDLKLIDEVNGSYEVLVKVTLGKAALGSLSFDTLTEINAHTQPQLHIGKNTVYVGAGEQTESIVYWPDFLNDAYKPYTSETANVRTKNAGKRSNMLAQDDPKKEGHVVFKVDSPAGGGDITSVTYGGRLSNRGENSHIDFLHSFDSGKTWQQDYSCTDTHPPWDIIHYEKISAIPPGTHSVLLKYSLNSPGKPGEESDDKHDEALQPTTAALYAVHMEVDHKLAGGMGVSPMSTSTPLEVTFNWEERQQDYTLVQHSHTQLVDKLPATYTIDVGGADHPIVHSLAVNLKGARQPGTIYGYSTVGIDSVEPAKDPGGEKWVGNWVTYGNNLALHKTYTVSIPSGTAFNAGDPDNKKLTDGIVGSPYIGGTNYKDGLSWSKKDSPEIVVDLGQPQKCAAFRIHMQAYPEWDSLKGENKDHVEVLVSDDNKDFKSVGNFNFNLRYKDLPVNFMLADSGVFAAGNYFLPLEMPVDARYVKYKLSSTRGMNCSEVQVLDSFSITPHDMRLALPDPASNGHAPPNADLSPNAKKWTPADLPQNIIGVQIKEP